MSLTSLTLFLYSILVAFLIALSFSCLTIYSIIQFSLVKYLLKCLYTRCSVLITYIYLSVHPSLDYGLSLATSMESSIALVRVSIILTVTILIWSYNRARGTSRRSLSTLQKISLFIFLKSCLVSSSCYSSQNLNTISTGRQLEPLSSSLLIPIWIRQSIISKVIKLRLISKGLIPTPLASLIISPSLKPSLSPLFSIILIRYSATILQLYLASGPPYLGQQRLKSLTTIVLQSSLFIYLIALFSFRSIYPLRRPSSQLYSRRGFRLQMLNTVIIYYYSSP